MGKKTIQVWRRVATHWEDAMSYDFPFLLSLLITRRYPSLLFLKFVPVSHLYLDRPSRADGFSSYLEVDHRKWEPRGNEFFPTGFARFPILWIHVSCFLLVYHCHSFTSLSLLSDCPSSEKGFIVSSTHTSSHLRECLCLSHAHISLISFHVISWHFVLTWLLSPSV